MRARPSPDHWPAQWRDVADFIADARRPDEARRWASPALDGKDRPIGLWWAAADDLSGFALIYHQMTAEIGFWLSPELRGNGFGSLLIRRGIAAIPHDKNRLLMASVANDNGAGLRTATAAGMRVMARQPARVTFVQYR